MCVCVCAVSVYARMCVRMCVCVDVCVCGCVCGGGGGWTGGCGGWMDGWMWCLHFIVQLQTVHTYLFKSCRGASLQVVQIRDFSKPRTVQRAPSPFLLLPPPPPSAILTFRNRGRSKPGKDVIAGNDGVPGKEVCCPPQCGVGREGAREDATRDRGKLFGL